MIDRFSGVILFLLVSTSALAQVTKNLSPISSLSNSPLPLVFIHGLKGAQLVDPSGDVHWVTPLQALGLNTPKLALPLMWSASPSGLAQDLVQDKDDLKAQKVLADVMVIPKFVGEKVYGPWLRAAANFGVPFYPFAYDWRRDNLETLKAFEAALDRIMAENKVTQVNVVAHSMGGLITMALMLKRPEIFKKIFFVGTPFHGGVGFLPDLHAGTATGLNKKILSNEVLFSFPSVYCLFSDDRVDTLDRHMNPRPVNFYDANDWKKFGLSVFSLPERNHDVDFDFLSKALERAKRFRKLLHAPLPKNQPETTVILGWKFPTLDKAVYKGPKSVRDWDFQSAPMVPGDGRVEANNMPPEGLKFQLFYSEKDHGNLLNDLKVIDLIKSSVTKK